MAKSRSVGTTFTVDSTKVGALSSIEGVSVSSETTDVTDMGNTDGYKEYLGGFKDGGDVPLSGFLDPDDSGQQAMYNAFEDQETHAFVISFPNGASWAFSGVVTEFKTAASTDSAITFDSSVKVSGKPTLTLTAAT